LSPDVIDNVWCGGENYDGARLLYYSWVEKLSNECKIADVSFSFFETGNVFIKDNKRIQFKNKAEQMKYAFLQNLNYESTRPKIFEIQNHMMQETLFDICEKSGSFFQQMCNYCSNKKFCTGCSNCGKCR